jgi:hypothetical protein
VVVPAPPKPPGPHTALRILLVLHAISLVVVGTPLFMLILALTAMVGGNGVTPFVVLALLVGPSIPLNILAAFHLTRRPSRARAYLGAAAVTACLQLLAALWFTVISGGLGVAAVVVPGGLMIAWFVVAIRTRVLTEPARPSRRPHLDAWRDIGIGALSLLLTVVLSMATLQILFES